MNYVSAAAGIKPMTMVLMQLCRPQHLCNSSLAYFLQLENLDDVRRSYDQESQWFIFNDSKVSFTTFESFVNMKNRFHSDTAYVLLYQKFTPLAAATTYAQIPLRSDLLVML